MLSIDVESGQVTELIDFTEAMEEYFDMTRPIAATDPMFWQVGEWDWIASEQSSVYGGRRQPDRLIP